MDMSMVEKRRVLRTRGARLKTIKFTFLLVRIVCSFVGLSALINSDLNVAKNPSLGSFMISAGVCGILFSSIFSFINEYK